MVKGPFGYQEHEGCQSQPPPWLQSTPTMSKRQALILASGGSHIGFVCVRGIDREPTCSLRTTNFVEAVFS